MIKRLFSILLVLLLLAIPNVGATATTYNQTFADTDNGGANIWQSITSGYATYWAMPGGSLQIFVINTTSTAGANGLNVTIHSGPFIQGALGDKLYTLSGNRTYILGPFDLSRFKQANETILVQSNATRGKILSISVES